MDDSVCYELRIISLTTSTSVKCCSPKSIPSFKASLGQHFISIMHAHKLRRLLQTSHQPNAGNFFLGLLFRRISRLLCTCGLSLVGVSRMTRDPQLRKTNIVCAYKQYGILFQNQTFKNCLTPCHMAWQHLLQRLMAAPKIKFGDFFIYFEKHLLYQQTLLGINFHLILIIFTNSNI